MNTLRTETKELSTITVSGRAELRDAAALKAALIESLDRRLPTVINLSGLERADVATLQLIGSAERTFSEASVPLFLSGEANSGAFHTTARAAGFPVSVPPMEKKETI